MLHCRDGVAPCEPASRSAFSHSSIDDIATLGLRAKRGGQRTLPPFRTALCQAESLLWPCPLACRRFCDLTNRVQSVVVRAIAFFELGIKGNSHLSGAGTGT